MLVLMLLFALMFESILTIDPAGLPLISRSLPFGLPAKVGHTPIAMIMLFFSMGITGLALAVLPAALSRKNILLIGTLVFSAATIMCIRSSSLLEFYGWILLAGVGYAMFFCAWISIGADYLPRRCAMVVACMNCITATNSMLHPRLLAIYQAANEQRVLPLLPALAGISLVILLFVLILHVFQRLSASDARHVILVDAKSAAAPLWSRRPMLLCLVLGCLLLSAFGLLVGYTAYLRETLGLSIKTATMMSKLFIVSELLSPLAAWLGDRFGAMKMLLLGLPVTTVVGGLMYMGWHLPTSVLALLALLAGFGFHALLYVNVLAALIQSVAPMQRLQAVGLYYAVYGCGVPFTVALAVNLRDRFDWPVFVLLQGIFPLMLATVLVWLALKSQRPATMTAPPG